MGMSVLDLGSGTGDVAMLAAELVGPTGRVVGIDSNPAAVTYAAKAYPASNLQFKLGQFDDLKNEQPFDWIYCIEVIEHLYENQVADIFSLFRKVTNPGASLF